MEDDNKFGDLTRKMPVNETLYDIPDDVRKISFNADVRTAPFKCAVFSCRNVTHEYDAENCCSYNFHSFPDVTDLRELWLQKCGLSDNFDTSCAKICSEHFSFDDYDENCKEEMIQFKGRLKSTAVPSLKLDGPGNVIRLPDNLQKVNVFEVRPIVDENNELQETFKKMCDEYEFLQQKLQTYELKLRRKEKEWWRIKAQSDKLKKRFSSARNHKNVLSQVFSESQVNVLLKKKKVFWSDDDLAMAFTLRQMGGRECYLYLKRVMNIPLPSLSCVQKWAASKN